VSWTPGEAYLAGLGTGILILVVVVVWGSIVLADLTDEANDEYWRRKKEDRE